MATKRIELLKDKRPGTIKGRISLCDNINISCSPGEGVYVRDLESGVVTQAVTIPGTQEASFTLENVPTGSRRIRYSKKGFVGATMKVELVAAQTHEFLLESLYLLQGNGCHISGQFSRIHTHVRTMFPIPAGADECAANPYYQNHSETFSVTVSHRETFNERVYPECTELTTTSGSFYYNWSLPEDKSRWHIVCDAYEDKCAISWDYQEVRAHDQNYVFDLRTHECGEVNTLTGLKFVVSEITWFPSPEFQGSPVGCYGLDRREVR